MKQAKPSNFPAKRRIIPGQPSDSGGDRSAEFSIAGVQRSYKDRMFCALFSDRENALSLFNALCKTQYTDLDALSIVTLSDTIYLAMKNDLAVCFHDCLLLTEQQSSVNPNMPLRGLMYFAKSYDAWLHAHQLEQAVYGRRLVKIPAPAYYVLYNGTETMPEQSVCRLSDAFAIQAQGYEWTATFLNINPGGNTELLKNCPVLDGYAKFCGKIQRLHKQGITTEAAIAAAIEECIREGILKSYLLKHKSEVEDMILTEYDQERFAAFMREDGRKEGIQEGLQKGIQEGLQEGLLTGQRSAYAKVIRTMLARNCSLEQIRSFTGLSEGEILEAAGKRPAR
ncbi:MAG: hypothetical protein Q4C60_11355 [Eubacteriales bacterium]|nr:hypothetical protein [Eubacteriales bacterium]